METHLADFIRDTPDGKEAEAILRSCVHCGFCTATCPTYQLLGDELDGPRGRIYLIKQMLEGQPVTERTRLHLDRCLTCRSCETTCPSGVRYHHLLDIGRKVLDEKLPRSGADALTRRVLAATLPRPTLFKTALGAGRLVRPILPKALKQKLPPQSSAHYPQTDTASLTRRMILLDGCVQPGLAPSINAAARHVLAALGIALETAPKAGCCGAVRFHLDQQDAALTDMRRQIDAWIPLLDNGAEAIVITASGCGAHVRDYGHLLRHDAAYAEKAARVSANARDISEVVVAEAAALTPLLTALDAPQAVAFHSPCTLQHGLQLRGIVEPLLTVAGFSLTPVADGHLCCGSAGTYSITQPEIAGQLKTNKLAALTAGTPQVIATANIGCLSHLATDSPVPVRHWIELIADCLS
jgi:glycolate oxidase iron-sulfur subunit